MKDIINKILEEIKEEYKEELGRVSFVFMSQGDTKSSDIIMPTEELLKSIDRFELRLKSAMEEVAREKDKEWYEILQSKAKHYHMREKLVIKEVKRDIIKKMDEYEHHKDEIHCTCLGALREFMVYERT